MDKHGFVAIIFVFVFVSTTGNASLVFHRRNLIVSEGNNASATPPVPPIASSPVNDSNTNTSSIDTEKSQLDKGNQANDNGTLPVDPKGSNKPDNDTKPLGAPSPPAGEKNGSIVDGDNGKANATVPNLDDNVSCEGSISSCRMQEMLACIKSLRDGGSEEMFLVTKNEGENTMKVNVKLPNSLKNIWPDFEVLKHTSKRINISSSLVKNNKLIVSSGSGARCELAFVQSVSVDKIIQQLSFYSKQVNPIYAIYASFVVTLLLGATWACCRLRKRNQQDGVQYQELEMGIPESASAADVNGSEGWDHDWDDDWDEEIAVKSPSGNQVRSVSADGLTSRSPKRDGWELDWED